ncbi:MAG: hypothetical protein IT353_18010 [Gemmatimonadaceae bacterium]|nr:hypothetical protein [Gemmatimonadaceae bacterium]
MHNTDDAAMSTVGAWFAALQPAPPAALATRMTELLGPHLSRPRADVPDVCLTVGEELLDALLASGSTSRGTALDLLAVDALVTYAFQAGADDPASLESRAARAMERIAALPSASHL